MDTAIHNQIINAIENALAGEQNGLQYQDLAKRVREKLKGTTAEQALGAGKLNPIASDYASQPDSAVYRPAKGLYRHKQYQETTPADQTAPHLGQTLPESAFYQSFADWLVNDVEECTTAKPVGGAILKDKWGTPDVMGIYKCREVYPIKLPIEVVSAEIKVSTDGLITAFGQACSYKLFSHKSYIVVPKAASKEDKDRLEALCLIFGIGLVVFDAISVEKPGYEIRTRAARHEPDTFYLNEKLMPIAKELLG